mmetsp:Transcript_12101/g.36739  ORF Transcript_12101/g.36739 Transcript_12101/m.36739 type:complete len:235 (+) Transcript_12101:667-1371(+)
MASESSATLESAPIPPVGSLASWAFSRPPPPGLQHQPSSDRPIHAGRLSEATSSPWYTISLSALSALEAFLATSNELQLSTSPLSVYPRLSKSTTWFCSMYWAIASAQMARTSPVCSKLTPSTTPLCVAITKFPLTTLTGGLRWPPGAVVPLVASTLLWLYPCLLVVPAGKNLESRDSISILMAPAACLAAWRATLLVTRYPPAKSTSASPICRSTLSMEAVAPSTRHSLTPRF